MASMRIIKRRIKSAKNIGQVTRALQMVSAVKMRKAQEVAVAGKPYAAELVSVLNKLAGKVEIDIHPFLNPPKSISKVTLVVIGPEKGLAGSLVTNIARKVFTTVDQINTDHKEAKITGISWGRKSREILKKARITVAADFSVKAKESISDQVHALANYLSKAYLSHDTDLVLIVYANFVNTMTQKPESFQFLPMVPATFKSEEKTDRVVSFEPSAQTVMASLLEHYLTTILNQIILDALAAEHSARMVAMKNASDNAADIVKYLTLSYNQTRQTAITNEIADIVSGSMISA
jgi:F-type H+-transporting ATPase subunit gamma